jgi:hypothetical protein
VPEALRVKIGPRSELSPLVVKLAPRDDDPLFSLPFYQRESVFTPGVE